MPQGGLVFIGVSPRLSNRETSIQTALEDAARRFSLYNSVNCTVLRRERIGGGIMDFHINRTYTLQYDEDLEKYIEQLEYDPLSDIYENNNALFIVTRVAANTDTPANRGHSSRGERPQWIDSPPSSIGGFITGVGYSTRLTSHADTVIKSYEYAIVGIMENIAIAVNSDHQHYLNSFSAFGFDINISNDLSSSGVLRNFYILESWTNPADLSVWTLAIARGEM